MLIYLRMDSSSGGVAAAQSLAGFICDQTVLSRKTIAKNSCSFEDSQTWRISGRYEEGTLLLEMINLKEEVYTSTRY